MDITNNVNFIERFKYGEIKHVNRLGGQLGVDGLGKPRKALK
jgi:hypothetical protein